MSQFGMVAQPVEKSAQKFAGLVACHALFLLGLVGCYDADALIEQRRFAAIQDRLEEVDLGEFRITLPPVGGASTHGVVAFHAFGLVANQHRDEVATSLEVRGPEFDHVMLLAVRRLTLENIEDPELEALRKTIEKAANQPFDQPFVRRVGFYKFNFMPL